MGFGTSHDAVVILQDENAMAKNYMESRPPKEMVLYALKVLPAIPSTMALTLEK